MHRPCCGVSTSSAATLATAGGNLRRCGTATPTGNVVFTDIHAAMAELRSGQEALVERRLSTMHDTASSDAESAHLYGTVGIPVVEALFAFHRGDYTEAMDLLLQTRFDVWQIGGSHAQRDVVDWT